MISEKPSKGKNKKAVAERQKQEDVSFKVNIPKEKVSAQVKRPRPQSSATEPKSEKKAATMVVVLSCVMAVITALTAVLGGVTDIFNQSNDEKAVAVLILPQDEKEELEKDLSKLWPLAETGFDTEKMSAEEIFDFIRPYAEDGLYTSFGYSAGAITHEADPAMRYADENGSYCYYKIPAEEIDSILSHFGLVTNHAINSENCYYFDSHYYFAAGESSGSKASGKVTVDDSKRIQDGRYYVEAKFGSQKTYVIASVQDKVWEIHSMSTEPVFDSLGIKIKTEDTPEDYEIRSLVIEGKADDGTVYSKYAIKYPYFFGDTQGDIQANTFYQSIITFYQQQSEQVEADYKKFIKKGGKTESLPVELHYSAEVSYADDEKICLINEIAESVPLYNEEPTETTQSSSATDNTEKVSVTLPKKTVECNTFDLETGVFMAKDAFVGKDYHKVSEILYRIYGGYPYESITGESDLSVQVPEDSGKLGEKIYNSASALCSDGYVFCYVTDEGIREDVVIPFEVLDSLTKTTEE